MARIGFPAISSNPAPKKGRTRTLRSVAYIVLFLNRARYILVHLCLDQLLILMQAGE